MNPYYIDEAVTLFHGDNRDVLATLPSNSVDACVTDPPYELGFMGRRWDSSGIAYDKYLWAEVWRVLKPGGHLLAFGGTRTWHRLACAIEDAGFEVRDSLAWMYGSGFPKSLDVSKAIDKNNGEVGRLWKFTAFMRTTGLTAKQLNDATGTFMGGHYLTEKSQPAIPTPELWQIIRPLCGDVPAWVDQLVERIAAEREVVGSKAGNLLAVAPGQDNDRSATTLDITAPATDAAKQWQGWGTALKPAFEPVVVARKPLVGTVAANVQQYGTGALNIDACRIDTNGESWSGNQVNAHEDYSGKVLGKFAKQYAKPSNPAGRWPANVILDEHQAAELDKQSGVTSSKVGWRGSLSSEGSHQGWKREAHAGFNGFRGHEDEGGASRFFYTAKASSAERPKDGDVAHPTVKPLDLMRYLVRLVTPPGGTVLEPFAGSGTTAEACIVEGFKCIAIEMTDDYLPLIVQRITKPIEMTLL